MADKEDLSLKLLQLQCIIDAKDRELQILREQASQDPEDIIDQLKHENEALKKQLNSSPSASTTAVNGCAALPHGVQGAASDAVAGLQKSSAALQQLLDMLAAGSHGSAGTKRATANGIVGKHDELVQLNVSGTYMEVPRSVLLQFPASRLAGMFAEDSSEAPLEDSHGRCYMPYEASAFSKIVSALQARHIFGPHCSYASIHIPRQADNNADALFWPYVKDLVNHLGLQQIIIGQPNVLPDQHAEPAAAAAAPAPLAAATAAAAQKGGRRSSSNGDRKSHGGSSSSNSRALGSSKAAAADSVGSKPPPAAAPMDPAAAAAASAAAATALLDSTAFAEKTSAQTAAEAQSAVLQALQPLQQPTGGVENLSPNRRDRHSKGSHHNTPDKSHRNSSSSSSGAGGHSAAAAAAGEGGNGAAAAPVMAGGVSNAMAAAALKGLIQQKRS